MFETQHWEEMLMYTYKSQEEGLEIINGKPMD